MFKMKTYNLDIYNIIPRLINSMEPETHTIEYLSSINVISNEINTTIIPATNQFNVYSLDNSLIKMEKYIFSYKPIAILINIASSTFILNPGNRLLLISDEIWYIVSNDIYTPITQDIGITGSGFVDASTQGFSVSLSSDGNTLAVGGDNDDGSVGAVWIFNKIDNIWNQIAKLIGLGNTGTSRQGTSVSLSGNGNILAVGGFNDNNGIGATWIFENVNGTWIQIGSKLLVSNRLGLSQQGISVSLSNDGNTLAIGGDNDNNGVGAVWIFDKVGGEWIQNIKLIGTGNIGQGRQGTSVSLSADGSVLAVGSSADNSVIGAVWIFNKINNIWSQNIKLVGTGNIGTCAQGKSVSLSSDGNILAVGGVNDNSGIGAAWIFEKSGNSWSQNVKLVGTGNIGNSNQGHSISLSGDGNILAVGGTGDDSAIGATWLYKRDIYNNWIQISKLIGSGHTEDSIQGHSVSLSGFGNALAVGAIGNDDFVGATWIFI